MRHSLNQYFNLTKSGIVCFVLFTASAGYFLGFPIAESFSLEKFSFFLIGLYFLSSGSFALNQFQERKLDKLMERTQNRPLANGDFAVRSVKILIAAFLTTGLFMCTMVSWKVGLLGLSTVILYNGFYTMYWKPKMPFAAVPGALPGAMPIVLGYTAASHTVFTLENIYFFLLMFFWQMPHYWSLALKYREDYARGGIPVLPAVRGDRYTLYLIGLYTFAYLGLALGAPFFAPVGWFYLLIATPFAFKVLWELFRYLQTQNNRQWLSFFLWTTFSVLVFVFVPAADRWSPWLF